MSVPSLSVIHRVPRGTRDAALTSLQISLCGSGCGRVTQERSAARLRAKGASWRLDILANDGSAAEYSNDDARGRARALATDATKAMTPSALESAGRAFIASKLTSVIVLEPGETLVPETVAYRSDSGGKTDGSGETTTVVSANRVVFSREINGIPVVGTGSKIILTFLSDGSVESFRYDWPKYALTGRVQTSAPIGNILQRIQKVVGAREDVHGLQPIFMPSQVTADTRIDLGADVQLERLACGYYDPGFTVRESVGVVQAGCYYHAVHYQGGSQGVVSAGLSGAVPASVQAERDDAWPEETLIRGVSASWGEPPPNAPSSR
ncbi:hypothetical protein [Pendulispora albinea]|uniref:Uncharacterized protein n=1 Tax=Pendulispora albinea TaxID=2741071 RepID=A0ABZ2LPZ4_9BACT